MFDLFEQFHFIRPLWFYVLIPTVLISIWLFLKKQKADNWSKICDQELLNYFLVNNGKASSRYPIILLFISWLITVFALAGPSWEKADSPIYTNQDALVIILDLSLSMNATDLKPSRLERAKHKLSDLLKQRQEGQTALMVYAGDAHIVSPLTPDNNTISSFIPVLDSSLMPIQGSNLNKALLVAEKLFKNAGIVQGDILLLTDGVESESMKQTIKHIKKLKKSAYTLSIIGIGTIDGAPIPDQNQSGFIKDSKGNIVLSKLDSQALKQLANSGGGNYHSITISDQDIQSILDKKQQTFEQKTKERNDKAIQWQDQGALLVLFILPLALLMFRRGWLFSFLIILLPYPYQPAYSMQWNDLWLRADQQGKQSFIAGQHEKAAQQFSNPLWKVSALYKAGKYQQAVEQYNLSDTNDAKYNAANSLAKLKRFEEAIELYNEVLEKNPQHQDSTKNKKIIEDLLKQQQQQQKDQKQQDKNNSDQNQDKKQNKDQEQKNNSEQKKSQQEQPSSEQEQKSQDNKESEQQQQEQQEQKNAEQEALNKQKEKQQQEQQEENKKLSEQESEQNKQPQDKPKDKQAAESLFSKLSEEEQQSMQQYLKQIKDDPAYLLRRKFYLNSTRAKQQNSNSNSNSNQSQAKQPW